MRKLNIDYKKHPAYRKKTGKILKKRFEQKYGKEKASILLENMNRFYEEFVADMPYTGGKDNPLWDQLYDSVACFAYWEALPEKETVEEFEETVAAVFVEKGFSLPDWCNANNTHFFQFVMKMILKMFAIMSKNMNKRTETGEWNNSWKLLINPDSPKEGGQMVLVGCPIYDFAQKHGYLHLMPANCNVDYRNMKGLGITLVRPFTVARGDAICDYRYVASKSETAKNYPVKKDDNGYLYNDLPV